MQDNQKESEREFHNRAFGEDSRKALDIFYSIAEGSRDDFQNLLKSNCRNKDVLEYGCGRGSHSYFLAENGAKKIIGIDISDVAIELARKRALSEGCNNMEFYVMDAEAMKFDDNTFDLICGTSILHHLDLERSVSEIARVLKPDGIATFIEPMAYNPAAFIFRKFTPKYRTPDEHPFTNADLQLLKRKFSNVNLRFYHLFTMIAIPLNRSFLFVPVLRVCELLDRIVFSIPIARLLAWQVVIQMERPNSLSGNRATVRSSALT